MNKNQLQTEGRIEQPKAEFKSSFKAWIRMVAFVVIVVFLPEQVAQAVEYDWRVFWNKPVAGTVAPGALKNLTNIDTALAIRNVLKDIANKPINAIKVSSNLTISLDKPLVMSNERIDEITEWLKGKPCGSQALYDYLTYSGIKVNEGDIAIMALTADIINEVVRPEGNPTVIKNSLYALSQASKFFGVDLIPVKITDFQDLNKLTPFIAHLNYEHYILVTKIAEEKVYYLDNHKEEFLPKEKFLNEFTGYALTPILPGEARLLDDLESKKIIGGYKRTGDWGRPSRAARRQAGVSVSAGDVKVRDLPNWQVNYMARALIGKNIDVEAIKRQMGDKTLNYLMNTLTRKGPYKAERSNYLKKINSGPGATESWYNSIPQRWTPQQIQALSRTLNATYGNQVPITTNYAILREWHEKYMTSHVGGEVRIRPATFLLKVYNPTVNVVTVANNRNRLAGYSVQFNYGAYSQRYSINHGFRQTLYNGSQEQHFIMGYGPQKGVAVVRVMRTPIRIPSSQFSSGYYFNFIRQVLPNNDVVGIRNGIGKDQEFTKYEYYGTNYKGVLNSEFINLNQEGQFKARGGYLITFDRDMANFNPQPLLEHSIVVQKLHHVRGFGQVPTEYVSGIAAIPNTKALGGISAMNPDVNFVDMKQNLSVVLSGSTKTPAMAANITFKDDAGATWRIKGWDGMRAVHIKLQHNIDPTKGPIGNMDSNTILVSDPDKSWKIEAPSATFFESLKFDSDKVGESGPSGNISFTGWEVGRSSPLAPLYNSAFNKAFGVLKKDGKIIDRDTGWDRVYGGYGGKKDGVFHRHLFSLDGVDYASKTGNLDSIDREAHIWEDSKNYNVRAFADYRFFDSHNPGLHSGETALYLKNQDGSIIERLQRIRDSQGRDLIKWNPTRDGDGYYSFTAYNNSSRYDERVGGGFINLRETRGREFVGSTPLIGGTPYSTIEVWNRGRKALGYYFNQLAADDNGNFTGFSYPTLLKLGSKNTNTNFISVEDLERSVDILVGQPVDIIRGDLHDSQQTAFDLMSLA
ncbi:MAG: hypothetical protein JXL82_01105, partial [Candidatus Omnitrophica bacterium]|nr:hypothetical protein [Candidatus Omnitrophota bacterium]